MNWDKLKENIYYRDGSFRDIYVLNTILSDNKKWVDYVNDNYRIEFFNTQTQVNESKIDFKIITAYWNGSEDVCVTAKIFIDNIQINNHFFTPTEFENDIDPKEINTIKDHKTVVEYMKNLSNLLQKPVILTPENSSDIVLIKVLNGTVSYEE